VAAIELGLANRYRSGLAPQHAHRIDPSQRGKLCIRRRAHRGNRGREFERPSCLGVNFLDTGKTVVAIEEKFLADRVRTQNSQGGDDGRWPALVDADAGECSESEFISFCVAKLGSFKTPRRIYILANLPKGPSGKVQCLRITEDL
jgi:acyl-CoA synthetase (AMP-forming)/AMP-acid ligase II